MKDITKKVGQGEYSVSGEYLVALHEFVWSKGVTPQMMLAGTDVDFATFIQPKIRVGHITMDQIIRNVIDVLPDPMVAVEYGQSIGFSFHGAFGAAIQNTTSLRQLGRFITQFVKTRAWHGEEIEMEVGDPWGHVILTGGDTYIDNEVARFYVLAFLSNAEYIMRRVTNTLDQELETQINLTYAGNTDDDAVAFPSGLTINFNHHRNEMCLPVSMLADTLPMSNEELFSMAQLLCEEELKDFDNPNDLSRKIRHVLRNANDRLPTLEEASSTIGMSPRTLQRKLRAKGISYQQLKDSERFRLAMELLKNSENTMEKIAERLGYSDAGSFNRAFKTWTGQPPAYFRDQKKL